MKKILHVYPKLNIGGTEKVMENIIKNMDSQKYKFTILTEEKGTGEEIFLKLGVEIKQIKASDNYWGQVETFLQQEKFDVIHVHNYEKMGSMLKIAKNNNIKVRIAHSHVSRIAPVWMKFLKSMKSYTTKKYATHYVACSVDAAKWLFQRKSKKSSILKNGISPKIFQYDEKTREQVRKKLAIQPTDFVIGIVARLSKEKNHSFIIDLLANIKDSNIKLLVVGDGPLMQDLKEQVKSHALEKKVIFTGAVLNPENYYNALDLFVLPSFYEGLGLSAVEAQYNGLYTLVSTNVPVDADIKEGLFARIPLEQSIWKEKIIEKKKQKLSRCKIKSKEYDMKENIRVLERIYE